MAGSITHQRAFHGVAVKLSCGAGIGFLLQLHCLPQFNTGRSTLSIKHQRRRAGVAFTTRVAHEHAATQVCLLQMIVRADTCFQHGSGRDIAIART